MKAKKYIATDHHGRHHEHLSLLAAVSGPKYEGSPYVAPKEDQPYDFTNKDGVSLWEAE